MENILLIYPDKYFNDFLKSFLFKRGYKVETAINGGFALNKLLNFKPDLILSVKEIPNLNLEGFLLKKKVIKEVADAPMYLIGDFSSAELIDFKKMGFKVFISYPINPFSLLERINMQFKKPNPPINDKTPMLMDINVKGNLLIIQIEANFEDDKLELMNYKIRSYCNYKKIRKPKFFFVIPSLYPESITVENIEILFSFLRYPELEVNYKFIKILTRNEKLIEILSSSELLSQIEIVPDYLYGINVLNIDMDKLKKIPISFLKPGVSCILDLYDDEGMIRIPAYSVITQDMLDYLARSGEKHLTYFSDKPFEEIETNKNVISTVSTFERISNILLEYETMEKYSDFAEIADDKMSLFFRRLKGLNSLILSNNKDDIEVIYNTFEPYMNIESIDYNINLMNYIEEKKCVLIFLDNDLAKPSALEILYSIRSKASRRKITVIIISKRMDKSTLSQYKKYGTDYVIISPFTTSKLLQKAFYFINNDRLT